MRYALLFIGLSSIALAETTSSTGVDLPAVVVTGKRPAAQPERHSEFTGERWRFEATRPTTLPQLLRQSPGVIVRQAGGEDTPPQYLIRGLDPNQHRFFLEGVPLTDAAYNAAPVQWLPTEALGSVDVYAEGVPVYLGDDGLGGAVQFHLPETCRDNGFGARAGSFGYLRVFGDPCVGRTRLGLTYTQSREDFLYYDDNGTPLVVEDDAIRRRTDNAFRRGTIFPQVEIYRDAHSRVHAFGLGVLGEKEIPGTTFAPSPGKLTQGYALAALKAETENFDGHLYGRFVDEKLKSTTPLASPSPNQATGREVGARLRAHAGPVEAVSGVTWESFAARSLTETGPPGDKERWQVPLGVTSRFDVGPLSVKPALMAHYYHYERPDDRKDLALVSPRLGLTAHMSPRVQARAAVGNYYRAPTLTELYGSPSGLAPNPALGVERAWKWEVGIDGEVRKPVAWIRAGRLSYTFSVSQSRNIVVTVASSPTTRTAINLGRSRIVAHEFQAELASRWDLTLKAGLGLFSTLNESDVAAQRGKELPFRPPYRGSLALSYERERWGAGYEALVTGPVFWDSINDKRLEAVTEHGVRAWWDTQVAGVVSLEVLNLGDVTTAPSTQIGFFELGQQRRFPRISGARKKVVPHMEIRIMNSMLAGLLVIATVVACSNSTTTNRATVKLPPPYPESHRTGRRVLLVGDNFDGGGARFEVAPFTAGLMTYTALTVPGNTTVRSPDYGPYDYLIMRGTRAVHVISKKDGSYVNQWAVPNCSPQDVLPVSDTEVYVTCLDDYSIRRLDAKTGAVKTEVPIDPKYAVTGQPPKLSLMTRDADTHAYVQVWRLLDGVSPSDASYVLVVDMNEDKVVSEFKLAGTNPFPDFKRGPDGALFVASVGKMGKQHALDGNIERLTGGNRIVVAKEEELGGDVLDFDLIDDQHGVALVTGEKTKLVTFTLGNGAATEVKVQLETAAYGLSSVIVDRESGEILVGDRDRAKPGIRVLAIDSLQQTRFVPVSLPISAMTMAR